MRPRTFLLVFVGLLLLLFVGLNWEAFAETRELNLIATRITLPFGLLMVGVVGVLTCVYLLVLGQAEAADLLQDRRDNKSLDKARRLAESEEESRFKQLQKFIEQEQRKLYDKLEEIQAQLGEAKLADSLREEVESEAEETRQRVAAAEESLADEIRSAKA